LLLTFAWYRFIFPKVAEREPNSALAQAVEQGVGEVLEAQSHQFPLMEFGGMVDRLHQEGLGKTFVFRTNGRDVPIALALPVDDSGRSHTWIFRDGTVLETAPRSTTQQDVDRYSAIMAPSDIPYAYMSESFGGNIARIVQDVSIGNDVLRNRVIRRSDRPEDATELLDKTRKAVGFARELKQRELQTKSTFAERLKTSLDETSGTGE
jgi:hypothetical protein